MFMKLTRKTAVKFQANIKFSRAGVWPSDKRLIFKMIVTASFAYSILLIKYKNQIISLY